ncbi:hypothetical protein FO440_22750 [Mucilaginibacter corticis]|uniref:Phage holin family protein n=1 Tax=Mucilaginibacter corticis TaxID=2597670 RepID=A0A556M8S1_9SPHI|nr:hypothetical protein [Mucilaginibacter corticis]TSJ36328.1 hypothetical protein FO440_22750 [Mucilaginibacter corticis]
MNRPAQQTAIIKQIKEYLEIKIKLLKYQGIDKAGEVIADVVTDVALGIAGLLAFIFFSISLALLIGYFLKSYWAGFGCVTLLYILISFSGHLIKVRLQKVFISLFFSKIFRNRNVVGVNAETPKVKPSEYPNE